MPWLRYLLPPLLLGPLLLLTGALDHRLGSSRLEASRTTRLDPKGTAILDRALCNWQPPRVLWLEAGFWQKVIQSDMAYQAEGRFLLGPGQRLRLDLGLRVGRTLGETHVIQEGQTCWEITQLGGDQRMVSRLEPDQAFETSTDGRAGPASILHDLRRRMTVTARADVLWKGHQVTRLGLCWNPLTAASLAPRGTPWPAYTPGRCVVYLDAASGWPFRLEWWGPAERPGRETPLVQMEFRDPVVNQPLSPERCLREFTFQPAPNEVPVPTPVLTRFTERGFQELVDEP